MNSTEPTKSKKLKIDLRTFLLTISFMLFIFLLVTLLMPRNDIIGIVLQTLAGLIFIVEQTWVKIFGREHLAKLSTLLGQPTFQQKLPLFAIPITTAILLITYYKISGTESKWYDVFLSMTLAVGFANLFYFMLLIAIPKWFRRIRHRKAQISDDQVLEHPVRANLVLLIVSTIMFITGTILLFPLSKISIDNVYLNMLPWALYLTLMMIVMYGWLLSILYFVLYGLLKLGYALNRLSLKIGEADRTFIRRTIWAFLLLFWLWGGVLLVLDMWSK